jgi:predicted DCC family thiol-disulfide oxidoreductase YuxK
MSRSFEPHARYPHSYRDDSAIPVFPDDHPIIIFDNICVLCSQFAQFVLRHDEARQVRLLSAQSRLGTALYLHYGLDAIDYQTNMLLMDGVACFKSEAILRIAAVLGWPWKIVGVARCLPLAFRDRVYDVVATNRFRWFGRRSTCFVPRPEDARRFLQ